MEYLLQNENVWLTKYIYEEAEKEYYETLAKATIFPLSSEIAKARQLLIDSRDSFKDSVIEPSIDPEAVKFLEKKSQQFETTIQNITKKLEQLDMRLTNLEKERNAAAKKDVQAAPQIVVDGDDVDLFASDSGEEAENAARAKQAILAAYNEKKSKKPAIVAKSSVLFDVKPWSDETDMTALEYEVRKIEAEGLFWGAGKLLPLPYGLKKLQIVCVVEDEKVSIDWLEEEITSITEHVQSVDIAAFNKI